MVNEHSEARADYEAAFEEGAQACERGESPDQTNPYDDWSFPGAMKSGWADDFAAAQAAREKWESDNAYRARNCVEAA